MALKGLNRAVTSTHIEAHMEASQTFDEQYKKYLNNGMTDEEARHLAAESASFVYKANYANLATEFFQQMLLLRGPKLTKTLNTAAEREAAGIVASKFASVPGLAGQVLSEGLEEAGQFVIQEEGKYFTDVKAGLVKEEGFGDRLTKYGSKGELWTSAFFGGLGGGVFHKVGPIIENKMGKMMHSNYVSEKQRTIDDLKSQTSRALEASAKIAKANKSGNKAERKAAEQEMYFSLGFSSAQNGTLDYMLDRYDNIKEMTKEERESYGFSDNYINEIDTHKEKIKKVAELWQENTRRYGHEVSESITKREFLLNELNEDFPTVKKNYDNLVTKLPRYTETTIEGRKLIDRNIEIKALEKTVKINQNIIDNAEIPNEAKERIKAETIALMDELVVKRGKLEEDTILYKDQLNDADTLSITSLDGKYGEDLTTAQTVIKLHEKAIKRNTEELINMTSAKGREQIRNVQNQIMEANKLKQKDRELKKDIEADEVLEQGEESESILSMEQIHDRVLAGDEEVISMIEDNPSLKTQYEDFKKGNLTPTSDLSVEENLGGATDFTNLSVKESNQQTVATTVSNTIDEHNPPVEDNTEFFKTTKEEEDKTKLSKTNALAWFSAYNENAADKDITEKSKAISNYLENPNTDLTNVEIRFDIDREYLQLPLKIHQEMRDALNSKKLPKDIGKVPIKAMLYKDGKPVQYAGFNMEINLHDDNYDNFKEDIKEVAAQNIRDQKKLIIEGIFNKQQYRSKILTKSNGHILTSKDKLSTFSEIPLTDIFTDIETIEFSYGSNNTFLNPKNKSKDNNIQGYVAQNGAIYAKVKTANGNNFPLRLRHTKLNNNEAELIYMLYQDILNNYDVILQNVSGEVIDYINNSPDSRINGLSTFLNFDKLTYSELLDILVFNGREKTLGKKESVLSVAPKTKNSKTGKEIPSTLFVGKYKIHSNDITDPEVKAKVISHLTEFRQRQISVKYLTNPEYKKYIVNNSLVVSNAKTSEPGNGRIFVQPTITYDDNLVLVDDKSVTKKEENVTNTTPVSNIETKKTDIERRRQEELNEALKSFDEQINTWKEIKEYTGVTTVEDALDAIYNKVDSDGRVDRNKIPGQAVYNFTEKEQKLIDFLNQKAGAASMSETLDSYIEELTNRRDKTKVSRDVKNKGGRINAKYDAELATLESQKTEVLDLKDSFSSLPKATSKQGIVNLNKNITSYNNSKIIKDRDYATTRIENMRSATDIINIAKEYNISYDYKKARKLEYSEMIKVSEGVKEQVIKIIKDQYDEILKNNNLDLITPKKTNYLVNKSLLGYGGDIDVYDVLANNDLDYVNVIEITSPFEGIVQMETSEGLVQRKVTFLKPHEYPEVVANNNELQRKSGLDTKDLFKRESWGKLVGKKYSIREATKDSLQARKELDELLPKIHDFETRYNTAFYADVIGIDPNSILETKLELKPTPIEPTLVNALSEKPSVELKEELTEKDPEILGASEITFEITPITSVPETNISEKVVTPEEVNNSIVETEEDKIKKQERLDRAKARKQSGNRGSAFKTIPNDNTNLTEELSIKGFEINHIRSLLPNVIGINIAEDYIEVLKNGDLAIGLFKENMIYLSKYATSGTGYHEAFHAVFRTMLSEKERTYLYKEAENHFYNYSEQEIKTLIDNHSISREEAIKIWYEEKLADEFKDFMLNSGESTYSYPKGLKGLFQRLMNWLNHVFNSKTTIKKLFNDIASSNYKNKKVNISRSVAYKSISAPTTNNKYEPQDVEDIVQQLAYIALNAEKSFTLDTKGLSKENVKKKIKEFKVQRIIEELEDKELDAIENNDTELETRVGKVLQDLTWFIGKTNDYVSSMGFKETDDTELDDSGNLIYKPSYEVSGKDAASKEIKAIVALTPKYSYYNVNDTSSKVYDTDSYLKFPKFENFGVVWNKLENKLIDKPSIFKDGKKIDSFDRMMDTLLKESKYHPELGVIRNTVLASDVHTQTKFHFVFSRTKGNYLDALVSGTEGNMTYKITSSDSFSKNKEIVNTWATEFRKNFGIWTNNEFIYDQNKLEIFKDLHFKIFNSITQDHKSKSIQKRNVEIGNNVYNVNTVELLTLELKTLGVNISSNALKKYIDNLDIEYPNNSTEVEKSIIQLENIYLNLDKALVSTKTYKGLIATKSGETTNKRKSGVITNDNNQILDQKFFTEELAGAEAEFVKVSGENTVPGPGGIKWIPQDNNLMSKKVNAIKQGDLTYLDMLNQSVMHKNSLWLKALTENEESRKKLSVTLYGNYKEENVGDAGNKAKNLKDSDKFNDMANKYLKGIYIGLAEADKSQQYYIEGFDLEPSQVTFNEKNELSLLSNNATTILLNYFTDEVNRMKLEHNKIVNKELKEEEQVLYYHFNLDKKGNRTPGNYLKSYLFPNMNLEELGVVTKDSEGNILKFDIKNNEKQLREYISDKFLNAVKKDIDLFTNYGILKQENGLLTNRSLDNEILRNNYNNNVATAVGDITLNSIIANVEFTKLFTQDPALYKLKGDGFEDFRKRIPLIIASGKDQRIFENGKYKVRESYNSAVIDNIISPSDYFDFDKNPENLKTIATATGLSEEKIRKMFDSYLKVNETDAQAWITIDLYRERMLGFGKWSDEHEASFDRIKSGKGNNSDNALFAQPLKTVHAEVIMYKGTVITQYNKQSEAVLLPNIVNNMQIGNLLKAMTNRKDENGNALPDADHVITLDGKKTGAIGIVNIRDKEGKILNSENIKLNTISLSNEFCFLQQDLPTKGIHDTLVGTQAVKNVLALLKMTETYDGLTGLETYNEYHNTISKLSNLGLVEIKETLGYNDKLGKITDRQKLNRKLRKEHINKVSNNIIENIDNNISLDSLPQVRIKIQNSVASMINRSTVKLKQSGGSMIQTSSFGINSAEVKLTDKVKKGIIWFKDPKTELLPSRLIEENSLNKEEIAIFTRLKEDLLKLELTKEQKILLRKQDLKDVEPSKKSLGLLLNVYCK